MPDTSSLFGTDCAACATAIHNAPDGYIVTDRGGHIVYANDRYCRMSGYGRAELATLNVRDIEQPDCEELSQSLASAAVAAPFDGLLRPSTHRRKDGSTYAITFLVHTLPADPDRFMVLIRDVTDENALKHQVQLSHYTIDRLADMVIWLDENGRYVFVNDAATNLLGYSREELSNMHVYDIDPLFTPEKWRAHWLEIEQRRSFKIETVNRSKSGFEIDIEVTVNFIEHEGVKFNCSIVRDISERVRMANELQLANQKLLHLSHTDELTQLANRRRLMECLRAEYARHARSGAPLSFILLDMDAFKGFNDHYGHLEGDACLQRLAGVLARHARRPDDLAARYGGEEFAYLLPTTDRAGAAEIAETIRTDIMDLGIPHARSAVASVVTASMGVTTAHCTDGGEPDKIIARADQLLYQAKKNGRNQIAVG